MSRASQRRAGRRLSTRRPPRVEPLEGRALLATFLVTNTNDAGAGSLRQAILSSNAAGSASQIKFAIPTTDPNFVDVDGGLSGGDGAADAYVIKPLSALPSLNGGFAIDLDAVTQRAFGGDTNPFGPEVVLDGSLAGGPSVHGLRLLSNDNVVMGLNIQRFTGAGIAIEGGDGNDAARNAIGTDATGTLAAANGSHGVAISGAAIDNNVGPYWDAILTTEHADVAPNYIGGSWDFRVRDRDNIAAHDPHRVLNHVAEEAREARPFGSQWDFVGTGAGEDYWKLSQGQDPEILYLGLGTQETNPSSFINWLPSDPRITFTTKWIQVDLVAVRGPGEVSLWQSGDTGPVVWMSSSEGGIDATDKAFIPAGGHIHYNWGFTAPGLYEVDLQARSFLNDGKGTATQSKVTTFYFGVETTIDPGNTIAHNGGDGVAITGASADGNAVRATASIHSNAGLGIDLNDDGVTANDAGDGDSGPNGLANFPVITAATTGATTGLVGTLGGLASTTYAVDFYASTAADPTGHGEGRRYLGTAEVITNGGGSASFNVTLPASSGAGDFFTATATSAADGTSEFSATFPSAAATADIAVISATTNGSAGLTVTYEITGAAVGGPFSLGFYRSADGLFGGDTLLGTIALTSASDRTVGTHVKTFTIGAGSGQVPLPGAGAAEVDSDYSLLAVADPTDAIVEDDDAPYSEDNTAAIIGAYHPAGGPIFVHGGPGADAVAVAGTGTLTVTLNASTAGSYSAGDVTEFRVRTHDGADAIGAAGVAKSLRIWAGAGDDTLTGGSANDTIDGGAGTDLLVESGNLNFTLTNASLVGNGTNALVGIERAELTGGAGNNRLDASGFSGPVALSGGAGKDTLTGGQGSDLLIGGVGDDAYVFKAPTASQTDTVIELLDEGKDKLDFADLGPSFPVTIDLSAAGTTVGSHTNRTVRVGAAGQAANLENLTGGDGDDLVTGNDGRNALLGGSGDDTLIGGLGNDTLDGNAGDDSLVGGLGNDTYRFGAATAPQVDTIVELAGEGTDKIDSSRLGAGDGVTIDLSVGGTAIGSHAGRTIRVGAAGQAANLEDVVGGDGNDRVTGNAASNEFLGGLGDDTLSGGVGNDTLEGGAGGDSLVGGSGNDVYRFRAAASAETDIVVELGGEGTDRLDFAKLAAADGLTIDLSAAGTAIGSHANRSIRVGAAGRAANLENVYAGAGDDRITGNAASNNLVGYAGDDTLDGGAGIDTLDGGTGTDVGTNGETLIDIP